MQLGMIGLGKMGANMARRLHQGGIEVIGYDRSEAAREALSGQHGVASADSVEKLFARLEAPRIVWIMVPAGKPTEQTISELAERMTPGDVIIDGGNANYHDTIRRHDFLQNNGIEFVDAGVSGGIWGLTEGYTLMLGGTEAAVAKARAAFEALAPAPDRGWLHCGSPGAGHYTKMIHNGIEYGMMQAYAEGFALLQNKEAFDFDLAAIAEMWRHGSVIRSWLLDLMTDALSEDQDLETIEAVVADSGEGRWTAIEAIEQGVPAPVIAAALAMRFSSQGGQDYASKLLAVTRKQFGGHAVKRKS